MKRTLKRSLKRTTALLLAVLMTFTGMDTSVFAEDTSGSAAASPESEPTVLIEDRTDTRVLSDGAVVNSVLRAMAGDSTSDDPNTTIKSIRMIDAPFADVEGWDIGKDQEILAYYVTDSMMDAENEEKAEAEASVIESEDSDSTADGEAADTEETAMLAPAYDGEPATVYIYSPDPVAFSENASGMFKDLSALKDITALSQMSFKAVKDATSLFEADTSLSDLSPLKGWKTDSLEKANRMFYGCAALDKTDGIEPVDMYTAVDTTDENGQPIRTQSYSYTSWQVKETVSVTDILTGTRIKEASQPSWITDAAAYQKEQEEEAEKKAEEASQESSDNKQPDESIETSQAEENSDPASESSDNKPAEESSGSSETKSSTEEKTEEHEGIRFTANKNGAGLVIGDASVFMSDTEGLYANDPLTLEDVSGDTGYLITDETTGSLTAFYGWTKIAKAVVGYKDGTTRIYTDITMDAPVELDLTKVSSIDITVEGMADVTASIIDNAAETTVSPAVTTSALRVIRRAASTSPDTMTYKTMYPGHEIGAGTSSGGYDYLCVNQARACPSDGTTYKAYSITDYNNINGIHYNLSAFEFILYNYWVNKYKPAGYTATYNIYGYNDPDSGRQYNITTNTACAIWLLIGQSPQGYTDTQLAEARKFVNAANNYAKNYRNGKAPENSVRSSIRFYTTLDAGGHMNIGKQPLVSVKLNPVPPKYNAALRIHKYSTDTDFSTKHSLSTSGAVFSVYSDKALTKKITTLTTGSNGYTSTYTWNNTALKGSGSSFTVYVVEDKAPDGYQRYQGYRSVTVTPTAESTSKTPKTVTLEFGDDPFVPAGQLRVHKVSTDSSVLSDPRYSLAGFQFSISTDYEGKNVLAVLTTDSTGYTPYLQVKEPGTYYAREITTPDTYTKPVYKVTASDTTPGAVDPQQTTLLRDGDVTFTFSNTPVPPPSRLTIKKTSTDPTADLDGKHFYDGAQFVVSKNEDGSDPVIQEGVTDENGILTTDTNGETPQLTLKEAGLYWIVEKKAPDNFQLATEAKSVNIKAGEDTEVSFPDVPIFDYQGQLQIYKQSALTDISEGDSHYSLAGAEFAVYGSKADMDAGKNALATLTTQVTGYSETVTLPSDKDYYVKETKAPAGFTIGTVANPVHLTADKANPLSVPITTVDVTDTPYLKGDADVTKTDAVFGTALDGAEFTLYAKKNGTWTKVKTLTPAGNGVYSTGTLYADATNPSGDFRITETKNPSGYTGTFTKDFTLSKDTQHFSFSATNSRPYTIRVNKVDKAGNPLAGASFGIAAWDSAKGAYGSYVTMTYDAAKKMYTAKVTPDSNNLGSFRIKELKAPTGYHADYEQDIRITASSATELTFTAENRKEHERAQINIAKTNASGMKLTDGTARFDVFQYDAAKGVYRTDVYDTLAYNAATKNYESTKDYLRIDETADSEYNAGKYKVVETTAPTGYVNEGWSKEFTITKNGDYKTIQLFGMTTPTYTVVNKPNEFVIKKVAPDGTTLINGVSFRIVNVTTGAVSTHKTGESEKGIIRLKNLAAGAYEYQETAVPAGYTLDTTKRTFTVTPDGKVNDKASDTVTIVNAPYQELTITKTDSAKGTPSSSNVIKMFDGTTFPTGAEFSIYEATSVTNGKATFSTTPYAVAVYTAAGFVDSATGLKVKLSYTDKNQGHFLVKETAWPEGYLHTETSKEATVASAGSTAAISVSFANTPNRFTLTKTGDGGKALAGVSFLIWKGQKASPDYSVTMTTNTNGQIVMERIPDGTWYYQETATAKGYSIDSTIRSFTVKNGQVNGKNTDAKTVTNQPSTNLIILKKDAVTGKATDFASGFPDGTEFEIFEWNKDKGAYETVPYGTAVYYGGKVSVVNPDGDEYPIPADPDSKDTGDLQAQTDIALIDTGAPLSEAVIARTSVYGDDLSDETGHGSHLADIIHQTAPEAKILSIKVSGKDHDATADDIASAIDIAIKHNVKVINISMSGPLTDEADKIDEAIDRADKAGIIVVVSAGNHNDDAGNYMPASSNKALTVAAAGEDGYLTESSSFGDSVDTAVKADTTSEAAAKASAYLAASSSYKTYKEDIKKGEESKDGFFLAPEKKTGTIYSSRRLVLIDNDGSHIPSNATLLSSVGNAYLLSFKSEEETEEAYLRLRNEHVSVTADTAVTTASQPAQSGYDAEYTAESNPIKALGDSVLTDHDITADVALIDTGASGDNVIKKVSVLGDDGEDRNGHGSDMAAAITRQNRNVSILSIKALDDNGVGSVSSVLAAIEYASRQNVKIINLSMTAYSPSGCDAIASAIRKAEAKGILVIGAAGNDNIDAHDTIPGGIDEVIVAGAADENGKELESSNWGPTVDIAVEAGSTSEAAAKLSGWLSRLDEDKIQGYYGYVIDDMQRNTNTSFHEPVKVGEGRSLKKTENVFTTASTVTTADGAFNYFDGSKWSGYRNTMPTKAGVAVNWVTSSTANARRIVMRVDAHPDTDNPIYAFSIHTQATGVSDIKFHAYLTDKDPSGNINAPSSPLATWSETVSLKNSDPGTRLNIWFNNLNITTEKPLYIYITAETSSTYGVHVGYCENKGDVSWWAGKGITNGLEVRLRTNNANGKISCDAFSGTSGYVATGSTLKVTASPNKGYGFAKFNWDSNYVYDNPHTYTNITKNTDQKENVFIVTAYFGKLLNVQLKVPAVQSTWGTITADKTGQQPEGADITVTATPNPGYEFAYFNWNSNLVYENPHLYTNITHNTDIAGGSTDYWIVTAFFKPKTYTITYNPNGGSGTAKTQTYKHGEDNTTLAANAFTRATVDKNYTVTFDSNGGSAVSSVTTTGGKVAYTLDGWATSATGAVAYACGESYKPEADATLYAHWKETVTAGSFTVPAAPTKEGYTFAGWYDSATGGTQIIAPGTTTATTTSDRKLYAHWTINTYTDTIGHWLSGFKNSEGNNGTKTMYGLGISTLSETYNSTFTLGTANAVTAPNGTQLAANFGTSSITGSWANYPMGTKVTQAAKNMSFEYDYNPITYTISYDLQGGTNNSANPTSYNVLYGVTLKDPTRTGYTFAGWYDASGKKVTGINPGATATFTSVDDLRTKLAARTTGNQKLTAHWTANTYTDTIYHWVTGFKNSEGNSSSKAQYKIDTTTFTAAYGSTFTMDATRAVTAPNGTKLGTSYGTTSVTGTWTSYNFGTTVTQKSAGMTFDYFYVPITYTITYDLQGGTNASTNPASYNALYGVTFANPTRTGYTFAGWTDAKGNKITGINPGANASFTSASDLRTKLAARTTGNQTVKANWTPNTYTITYSANAPAGTTATGTMAATSGKYGTSVKLAANAYKVTGYEFLGWATSATGAVTYADQGTVASLTGNMTLYARWRLSGKDVSISVVDASSGAYVSGTKMQILDSNGNSVISWTTGTTAYTSSALAGLKFGTYRIHEVSPAAGYEPNLNDTLFTVSASGASNVSITIKVHKEGVVSFVDKNTVSTTPAYPVLRKTETNEGKFLIRETKSTGGYIMDSSQVEVSMANATTDANGNKVLTASFTNQPNKLIIKKTASDGTTVLAGAVYKVWYGTDTASAKEYMTDANGLITIYRLKPGTWHYQETKAPAGYKLDSTTRDVTVDQNGYILGANAAKVESLTRNELNYKTTEHPATIRKTDENGGAVSGIQFTVTPPSGSAFTVTTGADGTAVIKNLLVGTYKYKEVAGQARLSQLGLIADPAEHSFTVSSAYAVTFASNNGTVVNTKNKLTIMKKDSAGKALAGVSFILTSPSGTAYTGVTDSTGRLVLDGHTAETVTLSGLPDGTWTYQETKTLPGYILDSAKKTFTVTKGLFPNGSGSYTLTVTNTTNKLTINKTNGATGLKGAVLHVWKDADGNGAFDQTLTTPTGDAVTLTALADGTYHLQEVTPPGGYWDQTNGSVTDFTVTNGVIKNSAGTVITSITRTNKANQVTIKKVDAKGNPIAGVSFKVTSTAGYNRTWTTGSNGITAPTQWGPSTYTITEASTPSGYLPLTETASFIVNKDGTITNNTDPANTHITFTQNGDASITFTIVNDKPSTAQITLTKKDANDLTRKLAGAVFELYSWNGTAYAPYSGSDSTSKFTDKGDGTYQFTGIQVSKGTGRRFMIKELETPDGYTGTYSKEFVFPDEPNMTYSYNWDVTNVKNRLVIRKVEIDENGKIVTNTDGTDKVLKDVEFAVTLNGKAYLVNGKNPVTDENGLITIDGVGGSVDGYPITIREVSTKGKYFLDETTYNLKAWKDGTITIDNPNALTTNKKSVSGIFTLTVSDEKDEPVIGNVEITKKDASGNILDGASFEIYEWSKAKNAYKTSPYKQASAASSMTRKTGSSGQPYWTNLQILTYTADNVGKFKIVETGAPAGFQKNYTGYVTLDKSKKTVQKFTLTAVDKENQLILKKVDESGKPVQGVVFDLKPTGTGSKWTKYNQTLTTDANGTFTITKLIPGTYTLQETTTVDGLALDKTVHTITVNDASEIWVDNDQAHRSSSYTFTAINGTNSLTIKKVDGDGKALAGAVFTLYQKGTGSDTKIQTATSGSDGTLKFTALKDGTYYFQETTAPSGYTLDPTKYGFTVRQGLISEEDPNTAVGGAQGEQHHTWSTDIKNSKTTNNPRGKITISKTDDKSGAVLTDAEFTAYPWNTETISYDKANGVVIPYDAVTKRYHKDDLPITNGNQGRYLVVETRNPKGYTGDWEGEVQLADGNTYNNASFSVTNARMNASIVIRKTDTDGSTALSGAEFTIWKDGETAKQGKVVTTGSDGTAAVEDLELSTTYHLQETKAPDGYALDPEDHLITVGDDGTVNGSEDFELTVKDARLHRISVAKGIYKDDLIAAHGAPTFIFKLTGTNVYGEKVERYESVTITKENSVSIQNQIDKYFKGCYGGLARFDDLLSGTYTIEEIPVEGYHLKQLYKTSSAAVWDPKAVSGTKLTFTIGDSDAVSDNWITGYGTTEGMFINDVEYPGLEHTSAAVNFIGSQSTATPWEQTAGGSTVKK